MAYKSTGAVFAFFHLFPKYTIILPFTCTKPAQKMLSLRYYLDTRRPSTRPDGKYPLKLAVTKHGDTAMLSVLAYATREEWDPKAQRLKGGRLGDAGRLNSYLARQMLRFEEVLRELAETETGPAMTALQIRDKLEARCFDSGPGVTLGEFYQRVRDEKSGSTKTLFDRARASFVRAVPRLMDLPLASITDREVARVDAYLREHLAQNTRNTYISKLTQVLKRAHREGLNAADAGRNIKLKLAASRSRALTVQQLRLLFSQTPTRALEGEALDFFRLSFYLRAINPIDLSRARKSDIFNGRLQYQRAKTGKDYSVKVEPEALEIIDRRGSASMLWAPSSYKHLRNYHQDLNDALRAISKRAGLPPVTMYWARHTFASLMLETGAPAEIISYALGHSFGARVTMGYVTVRERPVDEAARRVFDYVAGTWDIGE